MAPRPWCALVRLCASPRGGPELKGGVHVLKGEQPGFTHTPCICAGLPCLMRDAGHIESVESQVPELEPVLLSAGPLPSGPLDSMCLEHSGHSIKGVDGKNKQ